MRILTVANRLNRGGIEITLDRVIPRLQADGLTMDLCSFGPGSLDPGFLARGSRIWRMRKTANCWSTARRLQAILAANPYDVVHAHLDYVAGGMALGAARMGVPMVASIHNTVAISLCRWETIPVLRLVRAVWLAWHRRLMDRHVDVFVGHSRANLDAFRPGWRSDTERYRVILNALGLPADLPDAAEARRGLDLPDGATVLLHVGNFREQKNHRGLLEIFRRVLPRAPGAVLVLVGDGPLRAEMAKAAKDLGLESHVRFEGTRCDVCRYYAAADLFVFPSHFEGFGNVLVESQAAGCPVVASDIPAHRESIERSQHRFLFPLPDYSAAADLIVEQLEAARTKVNPWTAASRDFVRRRFTVQRMADEMHAIYDELGHRGGRQTRLRRAA